jgi:hypothetical protein
MADIPLGQQLTELWRQHSAEHAAHWDGVLTDARQLVADLAANASDTTPSTEGTDSNE